MPYSESHPLHPIVTGWLGVIDKCKQVKKEAFQDDADESMRFFAGPYNWIWEKRYSKKGGDEDNDGGAPEPTFKMQVNKTSEVVQIFGPTLYHRNPDRKVTPTAITSITEIVPPELAEDPQLAQLIQSEQATLPAIKFQRKVQSLLMERYLNYTPNELNLKDNARQAIDEALIKGMGILWTETWTDPLGRQKLVGSFYDTVDNLLIDPDAETIEDALFIIRKRMAPIWEVAERYNLDEKELKGNIESWTSQGSTSGQVGEDYRRKGGKANDSMCYYEIYSKMGAGHLLGGVKTELKNALDGLGKYVYLVVAPGTDYPLNLSKKMLEGAANDDALIDATSWPIPFWEDGEWPFTPIIFHTIPRCPWPQSHMKPGMGELKFLNWAYSFLASKIGVTCRDFLACPKSVAEEFKDTILNGKDLTLLEIEDLHGKTIQEVISFLQHPQFNGDIWHVIAAVEQNFEKRIGLNEMSYGMAQKQIRVAADAEVRQQATQVRPQDMANKVEDAMSAIARKEGIAARWLLESKDVEPVLGPSAAALWSVYIQNSDSLSVALELEYRVEAGQARKPNKEKEVQNMQTAMQTILPVLIETGNFTAANALIQDWAKSIDIIDPERYTLQPPAPQPDPKAELIQVELQAKLAEMDAKLKSEGMKAQMKLAQGQTKLVQGQQKHAADMQQTAEKGQVDILSDLLKAMTGNQIAQEKATTDQIIKLTTEESDAAGEKEKKK
jgi:hypothetical protein